MIRREIVRVGRTDYEIERHEYVTIVLRVYPSGDRVQLPARKAAEIVRAAAAADPLEA